MTLCRRASASDRSSPAGMPAWANFWSHVDPLISPARCQMPWPFVRIRYPTRMDSATGSHSRGTRLTIAAANAWDPRQLVVAFRSELAGEYRLIAARTHNPTPLAGWENRAYS